MGEANAAGSVISVGVNLLWLRPGRVGGSEDYAVRLLSAIAPDAPVRLTLFVLPGFAKAHPALAERHELSVVPQGRGRALRVVMEHTWLARQCRRRGLSVVHHLGGTVPWVGARPVVVTVHDIQPLDHPEHFGPIKRRYLRRALPWSVGKADAVITVSEFCRRRVIERLDPADTPVVVMSAPVDLSSGHAEGPLGAVEPDLDHPFVLYPAVAYPHKNHEVLLRALARLAHDGVDVEVVATGAPGPQDTALDRLATELGVGPRWHRLGRLPRSVLDGLYRQAAAVVFPSRYEGYGLPVVEAMVRGCPVVAADAGALPEVVGSGGRLVDPDDQAGWAEAIGALVGDADARREWSEAGRNRVGELAGGDPAEELVALYQRVAGGGDRGDGDPVARREARS
ncbi:glycosyltransferase family 4 protein [Candidatus Poriferisocius sp.]|uniref:glycosyltransferase family 4 protein n=1 Tax=Candidatus Poriferisocius sp. TaxID=3101276 RepID=UPI003B58BF7C